MALLSLCIEGDAFSYLLWASVTVSLDSNAGMEQCCSDDEFSSNQ